MCLWDPLHNWNGSSLSPGGASLWLEIKGKINTVRNGFVQFEAPLKLIKFHLQSQGTFIITEIWIWSQPKSERGATQEFGLRSPLTLWGHCLRWHHEFQGNLWLFPAFSPYFQFGVVLVTSLSCDTTGTFSSVLYLLHGFIPHIFHCIFIPILPCSLLLLPLPDYHLKCVQTKADSSAALGNLTHHSSEAERFLLFPSSPTPAKMCLN